MTRPGELFSSQHGPVWTPAVWSESPDQLVADAREALFWDQEQIDDVLHGSNNAMAGSGTAPQNEQEQLISTKPAAVSSVQKEWSSALTDMKETAPMTEGYVDPAP